MCSQQGWWKIFGSEAIQFQQIPERVNRFLLKPDPIVLNYTINPSVPPPDKPAAYDVEIKIDDMNLKSRMNHVAITMAADSAKELTKLDDEVRSMSPNSLYLF